MGFSLWPLLQGRIEEWHWEWHPMWWVWGAGGLVMLFMMLLFFGLVIVGFVAGVRWLMAGRPAPGIDPALAILRERYARGEIDREEFEARRRDLEASRR